MIEMASFIIKGLWAILVCMMEFLWSQIRQQERKNITSSMPLNFAGGKEFVFKPSSNVSGKGGV